MSNIAETATSLAPSKDPASPAVAEFLTFRCGESDYAVDIMAVREIRGWSEPTPLPYAPNFMRGVVNLRGAVLPVIDLAERLGHPRIDDDPRNVIIVIEGETELQGLLVTSVSDIVSASADDIKNVPSETVHLKDDPVERILMIEDSIVQVLSIAAVTRARYEISQEFPI